MSLKSIAQAEILVVEQEPEAGPTSPMDGMSVVPLGEEHHHHEPEGLEVSEHQESPLEVVLEFSGDLPGAAHSPDIEVHDEPPLEVQEDTAKVDENEAKKSKKSEKWDWESKGATGFVAWIKERFDSVPKHSGYDSAGLERAVSYLEKLDSEISRAMRLDLEGELDADKVEEIRSKIDDGIERLHDRLDKVKKSKKGRRKKSDFETSEMIKVAQKVTGVQGIYIVAPLFASRIARICINSMISAGHDIEDVYSKLVKKHKLTDREQGEVMQLLADMGYPLRQDRGYMPDEDVDVASSDNFDWAANYKG